MGPKIKKMVPLCKDLKYLQFSDDWNKTSTVTYTNMCSESKIRRVLHPMSFDMKSDLPSVFSAFLLNNRTESQFIRGLKLCGL